MGEYFTFYNKRVGALLTVKFVKKVGQKNEKCTTMPHPDFPVTGTVPKSVNYQLHRFFIIFIVYICFTC